MVAAACPDLASLETVPLPPEIRDHVATCPSCKLVADVFAEGDPGVDDCGRFDALLAARSDGTLNGAGINLLDRHLASCESCRAVSETLSPSTDARGDHADLPRVDPDAYALGLEVARGGMGRILSARDLRVGRPVAVKELLGRMPHLAARFEREARVTARLQHPGIVPIYEIGRWPDGTPFYSMRMVEGGTLGAAIKNAKSLPARLALLPALIAACEAVAFAHSQRVIHRDLTPANVLVGPYGETVVIDWGLAKDLTSPEIDDDDARLATPLRTEGELTGTGAILGTLAYMPPEQARAEHVDERSDVYALGAILYHLLAGKPPYGAKRPEDLLAQVKAAEPPAIDVVAPGSPRDLISIVTKAMARSPDARYPSARELAEELNRFQTGRMVEAHQYSRRELMRRFLRRNRAAVTVTVLAALVLGAVGVIAVTRIVRSREEARELAQELVLEKGRLEWLSGDSQRAVAYLYDAYQTGVRGPTIDFLLAATLSDVAPSERILDCQGDARAAEFSPDGKHLAVACHDRVVIWEFPSGKHLATLGAKKSIAAGAFDSVQYSRDGTLIVTAGSEGTARLWNGDGTPRGIEIRHGARINFARFTPDAKRLATTGEDGFAHIWDVATGKRVQTIDGRLNPLIPRMYGLLLPNGKHLVGATFDGTGRGWDINTGELLGGFQHGSLIVGGTTSPDGRRALTCDLTGVAKLWDTETIEADRNLNRPPLHVLFGHTDVVWKCLFSPDSKRALTTSHDGMAKIWDVDNGQLVASVNHDDIIWIGNFSPDGRRFVTVGIRGRAKVWDTTSGALLASYDTHKGKDAIFSRDGKRLVVLRGDERVEIFGLPTMRRGSFEPPAKTTIVAVTTDGTHVVIDDNELALVSVEAGRREHETLLLPVAAGERVIVAMTPADAPTGRELAVVDVSGKTQRRFVVGGEPAELKLAANERRVLVTLRGGLAPEIWDLERGERVLVLTDATQGILSGDGTRALAWRDDAAPVIWDIDARTRGVALPLAGEYRPISFAANGTRIAVLESEPVAVSLWDTESGIPVLRLTETNAYPTIDRSGRWLTTIGADRILTVRDTVDGSVLYSFQSERTREAQASPDGQLVVAIDDHNRMMMILDGAGLLLARWPITHPDARVTLEEMRAPNAYAAWTPDGSAIVTRSSNVDTWNVANPYGPAAMADVMKKQPWRLVNGRLELVQNGQLAGRVVRGTTPVANANIRVQIRRPANVGTRIDWDSMKAKVSTRVLATGSDGEFALDNLVPGDYSLEIVVDGETTRTTVVFVTADDDPVTIDLSQ